MALAIWAPGENGPDQPSTSRVWDYWLGGSHHTNADRVLADQIMVCAPHVPYGLRIHRAFLRRATSYLAKAGVRQFIDLGSGAPTMGNVHDIAQGVDPTARVIYTDLDPVVVTEGRELLAENNNAAYVRADLRKPEQVMDTPERRTLIDLNEPVALLLVDVLHFLTDNDEPERLVGTYLDALPPGSYLAISHMGADDGVLAAMKMFNRMYATPLPTLTFRGPDRLADFHAGLELVDPGIVTVPNWRPDGEDPDIGRNPDQFHDHALLARKPVPGAPSGDQR